MHLSFSLALIVLITSCANSERVSEKLPEREMEQSGISDREDTWFSLQQRFSKERKSGVDFIAFGKKPDWQLVITNSNDLSLNTNSDFGSFGAPNVEGSQPQDLNAMIYGAHTSNGIISVTVFSDSCIAQGEGLLPNRVRISVKKDEGTLTEFKGCGLYLNDPALHDIWAVKNWSALSSDQNTPSGAYLEFKLQSNRIYGNLGCGEVTGYFTPKGSKMKIYGMDYADKNCAEESASMQLFNKLNFSTHELIRSGLELRLVNDNDTITLSKAD